MVHKHDSGADGVSVSSLIVSESSASLYTKITVLYMYTNYAYKLSIPLCTCIHNIIISSYYNLLNAPLHSMATA